VMLLHGEFGLEVIALIGQWRYREHRSVPEMHQMLLACGISIAQRSVTQLMESNMSANPREDDLHGIPMDEEDFERLVSGETYYRYEIYEDVL